MRGRNTLVSAGLGVLAAAPVVGLVIAGVAPGDLLRASARGLVAEVDSVGWVLVPQLVLAVGILGLALQQGVRRAAGPGVCSDALPNEPAAWSKPPSAGEGAPAGPGDAPNSRGA